MELFAKLFGSLRVFVYHCFDRVVIQGCLSGLSRPEQVVYFFREVGGEAVIGQDVLARRTNAYQGWVEAFARNHGTPVEWAERGVRKEDYVRPAQRRRERGSRHGVYFILKSMEQGNTFRSTVPKFPTADPNHRIRGPRYGLNRLRYDLRKMKAHGLLERDGKRYAYRLTDQGVTVALLFILFHKQLCGPLANSRFHHQPHAESRPNSRLASALHKADAPIRGIIQISGGSLRFWKYLCLRLKR